MKKESREAMNGTSWIKKITAAALSLSIVMLTACADSGSASGNTKGGSPAGGDLTRGITAQPVSTGGKNPSATVSATDFGLRMFKGEWKTGENVLVSPVSVLFALGMTANGAKGDTLTQLEDAFGMSLDELNAYLYAYRASLPNEQNCRVTAANSIWFKQKESLSISRDFLQKNADYYAAGVFEEPFDGSTRDAINKWVAQNTEGMINEILDQIPEDAVMYLVNAMAFDAKWKEQYTKDQIQEDVFNGYDGTRQKVDFLYSEENKFLADENAVGFLKYYEGGKYAFAALLPNEGVALEDYVASLSGEKLNHMLVNPETITVYASIPKFEANYSTELGNTLRGMGIDDAFEAFKADFSGLGESADGNIHIDKVLHKTYICVDENGTKAAAVTAVQMTDECALIEEPQYQVVYLDRPFVYFLIDCEEGLPIFMGTVYTVE